MSISQKTLENQAARRARKRAAGECTRCPAKVAPGQIQCESCRNRRRARTQGLVSAGLCMSCEQPNDTIGKVCTKCCAEAKKRREGLRAAGKCERCAQPNDRKGIHCSRCAARQSVIEKRIWRERQQRVFIAYGNACSCCGETIREFLELDHVNNDGAKQRKELKSAEAIYDWVEQNNYPGSMQLLCSNCNQGKARNGGVCPHHSFTLAKEPVAALAWYDKTCLHM